LTIYWNTQQFEKINIIANGIIVQEYSYENLLQINSKEILGYELPKGVFEIKWDIIFLKNLSKIDSFVMEFIGLMVPPDISFGICCESTNYLSYCENMAGSYFSC
jgi:hypothetical protein